MAMRRIELSTPLCAIVSSYLTCSEAPIFLHWRRHSASLRTFSTFSGGVPGGIENRSLGRALADSPVPLGLKFTDRRYSSISTSQSLSSSFPAALSWTDYPSSFSIASSPFR